MAEEEHGVCGFPSLLSLRALHPLPCTFYIFCTLVIVNKLLNFYSQELESVPESIQSALTDLVHKSHVDYLFIYLFISRPVWLFSNQNFK